MADPRFPFVQFEFTHAIGPPAGRYVVQPFVAPTPPTRSAPAPRDDPFEFEFDKGGSQPVVTEAAEAEAEVPEQRPVYGEGDAALLGSADVLFVQVFGAPSARPRMFRRRQAKNAEHGTSTNEVPVTLVTLAMGTRMQPTPGHAKELLRGIKASPGEQEEWILAAFGTVNRSIAAYRACAADPYVCDMTREDPRAIRIGYATAVGLVSNDWDEAITVPPPDPPHIKREYRLMPQQGVAAVLTGKMRVLEGEELVLRCRMDLEQGRVRAAAIGLRGALLLLRAEMSADRLAASVNRKLELVVAAEPEIAELARRAGDGPLGKVETERLAELIESVGEVVDFWRYEPLGFAS